MNAHADTAPPFREGTGRQVRDRQQGAVASPEVSGASRPFTHRPKGWVDTLRCGACIRRHSAPSVLPPCHRGQGAARGGPTRPRTAGMRRFAPLLCPAGSAAHMRLELWEILVVRLVGVACALQHLLGDALADVGDGRARILHLALQLRRQRRQLMHGGGAVTRGRRWWGPWRAPAALHFRSGSRGGEHILGRGGGRGMGS